MRFLRKLPASLRSGRARLLLGILALGSALLVVSSRRGSPFTTKLQGELNNRAFARLSMDKAVAKPAAPEVREFWVAYRALELANQRKYRPIAAKYGLEPQHFLVAFKVHGAAVLISLFPEKMLQGLSQATGDYVTELKLLRDLSPPEDRSFFDYAVAQEQAQAEALQHASAGRFEQGAEILRAFVRANT